MMGFQLVHSGQKNVDSGQGGGQGIFRQNLGQHGGVFSFF